MVLGEDDTEDGQPVTVPETEEEKAQFEQYIKGVQEQARQEALENISAEQELAITQNFIAKSGKKFMGSEGKYPFLSEAVNSDEEKLKRVSNLQQWEINRVKIFSQLEEFLLKIKMNDFAKSVSAEKKEIMKLMIS